MSLIDFMDESSEMFMEARDEEKQLNRMGKKIEKDFDGKVKSPRDANKAMKNVQKYTDKGERLYNHDMKYNKKAANDQRRAFNGDTDAANRYEKRAAYALDAMDRHERRHKNESAIDFI